MITSQLITGILQDRFGRKKVIAGKAILCLAFLIPLIPIGFMDDKSLINVALGFLFLAMLFSTFNFDLMLMGFEKLPSASRINYIIMVSATRITGIGLIAIVFYFA
jgi:MFS family permease